MKQSAIKTKYKTRGIRKLKIPWDENKIRKYFVNIGKFKVFPVVLFQPCETWLKIILFF